MARGRLFRRNRQPEEPPTGPGSVTGRKASGIMLASDPGDWAPADPGVAPAAEAPETRPEDWVPRGLPEATSEPPPPSRKRSTVFEVPPELLAATAADAAPADPAATAELQRTLEQMRAAVEESRAETKRLRAELEAAKARPPAEPAAPAAEPVVPAVEPAAPAAEPAEPVRPAHPRASIVNLNTASVEELMSLPGVGERAARRVIAHREERGPYATVDALLAVEGFHSERLRRLAGRVTV